MNQQQIFLHLKVISNQIHQLTIQSATKKYLAYKPRTISDNGSQFISKDFSQFIKFAVLQHIRISIAYPPANGKIEKFHRTAGEECLSKSSFISLEDARKQIADYIDFYNTRRLHSSLYYLTPEDFLMERDKDKLKVRESKLTQARNNRIEIRNAV